MTMADAYNCASSEVSSTFSYRRRFENLTRREALEKKFNRVATEASPIGSRKRDDVINYEVPAGPQIPESLSAGTGPQTPPRLHPKSPRHKRFPINIYERSPPRSNGDILESNTSFTKTQQISTSMIPAGQASTEREHSDINNSIDDGDNDGTLQLPSSKPQHLQNQSLENFRFYRVVYRGVVALLSEATTTSQRSGAYVSYGEIIASQSEFEVDDSSTSPITPKRNNSPREYTGHGGGGGRITGNNNNNNNNVPSPDSPPRSVFSQTAASVSSLDTMKTSSTALHNANEGKKHSEDPILITKKAIRVDRVVTGGYAVDGVDHGQTVQASDQTPKRGNTQAIPMVGPSPLPISESLSISYSASDETKGSSNNGDTIPIQQQQLGYVFSHRKQVPILEPIDFVPKYETGVFLYQVVSSTPLPILTGPCSDAPKTKAMLLPGTIHEVCLRIVQRNTTRDHENITHFLRLSRRRGWVADRKPSARSSKHVVLAMKDVTNDGQCTGDDITVSGMSITSSVATPSSAARRRHRPPRRRRNVVKDSGDLTPLPRHIGGHLSRSHETPRSLESPLFNTSHASEKIMSPSSNVSMLSDESSLGHTTLSHKHSMAVTPDRSVVRSTASSSTTVAPSFFLMRVNAPRGLNILDAPHFQVNNLIHGNHPSPAAMSPNSSKTEFTNQSTNKSIFQTMAAHHSTTLTSKIGNPAIFDSITKARKLPRGAVFEASKRIEASGAFNTGAGLIKLSDNSGWAIVPRQEDLDEQYKHYHGGVAGIKEGEATRAYEEVGNALVDDRSSSLFLRILPKCGLNVAIPPPLSTVSDDETSPTSSAGGSSAVSIGTNGNLTGQESDVASSVGSSFLDSMFRTPKKRDPDTSSSVEQSRRDIPPATRNLTLQSDKVPYSTTIPCGLCVEVEKWLDTTESDDQQPLRIEYTRLKGGQGWIPRHMDGKPVTEIVSAPEYRYGSFWFRVQSKRGIKVRLGPSRRAPSIKSDDGVYFRFECGEFLRASEIMTIFHRNLPQECFAKLYRNRHVRLHNGHEEYKQLASLTAQSEWVHVFCENELYLEECASEPRIERHRQGWRYNVVLDCRVQVRKGPSFSAEANGVVLLGGESVLINERVTGPGENVTWLRMKDGQGWVHNVGENGEALMIPHSLKHRKLALGGGGGGGGSSKIGQDHQEDIAYNTIIARLFHSDLPDESFGSKGSSGSSRLHHHR